jgi:ribose transport system substrate-binding protein
MTTSTTRLRIAVSEKNQDPYWDVLNRGFYDAAGRLGVELDIRAPRLEQADEQLRQIHTMLDEGVDGLAVVGSDPAVLASAIDRAVAAGLPVVSFDLDAPGSHRHAHVGTWDYPRLGRMAAECLAEVVPPGSSVLVQVGSRHGAGALGKAAGFMEEIENRGLHVVEVTYDTHDAHEAEQQALAVLKRYPDLGALFGVYGYHPGAQLRALAQVARRDPPKIVGFDLLEPTIQGMRDGTVHASIWIQEYRFGYVSTAMLSHMVRIGITETLVMCGLDVANCRGNRVTVDPVLVRHDQLEALIPRLAEMGIGPQR